MNRRTYVGGAFRQKATPVLCEALQVAPSMKQILHFRPNFFGFTLPNIITNINEDLLTNHLPCQRHHLALTGIAIKASFYSRSVPCDQA